MTDTDLIVPIRVHALAVNQHVYLTNGFNRWWPNFNNMLNNKESAEPYAPRRYPDFEAPALGGTPGRPSFESFGGIHVQWELPEALSEGFTDPETGEPHFPLVPNRWLVVRYSGALPSRVARGWVVHSDYLEFRDISEIGEYAQDLYITPGETPGVNYIGRIYDLSKGPWVEPSRKPGFLTAVGPGTPGFAFFDPYHYGVFSIRDNLADLRTGLGLYPDLASLSYQVIGWYSDDTFDLLHRAHAGEIPGLLPPGAETLADTLAALGWKPTAGPDGEPDLPATVTRTVYAGRALGLDWSLSAPIPDLDKPSTGVVKVTIAHSTDEAIGTLVRHQTGDERTAELMQALVQGTVERLDEPVGDYTMNQATHTSWFASSGSGRTWSIEPRPDAEDVPDPTPRDRQWLAELNHNQSAYENTLAELVYTQQRTWTLTWLLDMPAGYNTSEDAAADLMAELAHYLGPLPTVQWLNDLPAPLAPAHSAEVAGQLAAAGNSPWVRSLSPDERVRLMELARTALSPVETPYVGVIPPDWDKAEAIAEREQLATSVDELREQAARQLDQIPHAPAGGADSDAALDAAADAFATDQGLSPRLQLRAGPGTTYFAPGDPIVVLEGAGNRQPLARDLDDPLPLRVPSHLLTEVTFNGIPRQTPSTAPEPDLTGLPPHIQQDTKALLCEFSILDQAAFTPRTGGGGTVLQVVVADPPANSKGPWPEYTQQWRQAWQPAYLSWHLDYVRLPYHDGDGTHWQLNPYTLTQVWDGTGAEPGTPSDEGGLRWHSFATRTYLTPAPSAIMRAQLARYLETFPYLPRQGLTALRQELLASDTLVQTLDGFNTWVLQQDPTTNLSPAPADAAIVGAQDTSPVPGANSFQPIRAGQFCFRELEIIDRFGRLLSLVSNESQGQFIPLRAPSVVPDHKASDSLTSPLRFLQLPPRLLQPTRLVFAAAPPSTPPDAGKAAAEGWLVYNLIDQSLLVYAPDGTGLGAVRLTVTSAGGQAATWAPLPFAPYPDLADPAFARDHRELHGLLTGLTSQPDSASAYRALLESIENSLQAGTDPLATDDHTLARLTGRPIAVIRACLRLELQGPPEPNPSWATAVHPGRDDLLDAAFPIRLGDPIEPSEGLIGYFTSTGGVVTGEDEHDTDYGTLFARIPAPGSAYVQPITNGDDLAVPARFVHDEADPPLTRYVTLLADPHAAVYAITDILPVQALRLDPDQVHQSLADLRTVVTLAPLLAPTRNQRSAETTIGTGWGTSTPQAGPVDTILDGRDLTWYESSQPPLPGENVTIDLGERQHVVAVTAVFGQPDGQRTAPAKKLQASSDGAAWTDLGTAGATDTTLTWPLPASAVRPPVSARFLRLEMTESAGQSTVIRSVEITCDPDDNHLVMPEPAAWYGTFDWAELRPPGSAHAWHAYPLAEADALSHPDDPPQVARAGFLRQQPPLAAEIEPEL
jgi:hypothetical protein